MSEQNPEQTGHQDPAEPYQDDTQVQTEGQPEPSPDGGDDDGDDADDAPVPAEPQPVEVSPEPTPTEQSDVKTDKVFDTDYEVTPDRGYRVKKD